MLLKHTYIHARPGQEKAKHHAGWSSSGDAAASVDGFAHLRDVKNMVEIREREFNQTALSISAVLHSGYGFCFWVSDHQMPRSPDHPVLPIPLPGSSHF